MKFFINSGVLGRLPKDYVTEGESQLIFSIPNYLEEERRHEDIKFVFKIKGINKNFFEGDLLLRNISLRKTGKNSYTINSSKSTPGRYIYALIRSNVIVPDDVFIPVNKKDRVKVLQRIRFVDIEPDYGSFLSNVYLIRIDLKSGEEIPIYLSSENPRVLERHHVIFKPSSSDGYSVTKLLNTHIYFDDEYIISLSEL